MKSHTIQEFLVRPQTEGPCCICDGCPDGEYPEGSLSTLKSCDPWVSNSSCCLFWDSDDGWRVGTLCPFCAADVLEQIPSPSDYAFPTVKELTLDGVLTDEDFLDVLVF